MPARDLHWPPELHPATAPVFVHNEIYIPAEPERVWAELVRATHWPEIYSHCRSLRFSDDTGPDLSPNAELSWRTFGLRVTTTVTEFEPPHRLAWRSKLPGGYAYHGWVVDPFDDGCRVITQTAQSGLMPSLGRAMIRLLLRRGHQRWLEGLAKAIGETDDPLGSAEMGKMAEMGEKAEPHEPV